MTDDKTVEAPAATQVRAPDPTDALAAARPPVGTGPVPLFGALIGLALIALGVVGVQEGLVRSGVISQESWTRDVVTSVNALVVRGWMLPGFVALAVLGLLLLAVVIKPRPRKALSLRANTGVYLRTRDLPRLVDTLLEDAEGVVGVSSSATRSRLRVTVTTLGPAEENGALEGALGERLEPLVAALDRSPRITFDIRNEDLA